MAKPIEVKHAGSPYHVSVQEAKQLVHLGHADWKGPRMVVMKSADLTLRVTWQPRQSGYAGPLVMQVVT
jgi:hypothetical protein